MRKYAAANQHQLYFAAASLAAQSNFGPKGFRQRDLKFFVELFSNWMESTLEASSLEVHNAQVARYLADLVENGFAQKLGKSGVPRYRLIRAGVVGILQLLVEQPRILPLEQFFFLYYFVVNYGNRLDEIVREQGKLFPTALKLELDALKDPRLLMDRQIRFIEKEIRKLQARMDDAQAASDLAASLFSSGKSTPEVIRSIQEKYPYELNNQKPLTELFAEIPEGLRRFELETGSAQRGFFLWRPLRDHFRAYLEVLRSLEGKASPKRR